MEYTYDKISTKEQFIPLMLKILLQFNQ